jgi:uncharacterized protein (DUF305 family)
VALVCACIGASCKTAAKTTAVPAGSPPPPQQAPPIVQPGAPGQASRVISAQKASDLSQVQYTGADIKFMQGMIGHHAQAIEMTEMLATRTNSEDLRKLAERIQISQDDEIHMMQTWLAVRGQQVPDRNELHRHGATLMPGMLTPDEMKQLADARGAEFDKLFLEGMIKHHGGALTMVQELFASPGAGQDSEIFAFASDVDADQRMEIDRMTALLNRIKEHQR